jgi:hypothetical protein
MIARAGTQSGLVAVDIGLIPIHIDHKVIPNSMIIMPGFYVEAIGHHFLPKAGDKFSGTSLSLAWFLSYYLFF